MKLWASTANHYYTICTHLQAVQKKPRRKKESFQKNQNSHALFFISVFIAQKQRCIYFAHKKFQVNISSK